MTFALRRPVRLSAAALTLGVLIAGAGLAAVSTPAHALSLAVTTTADVSDAPGCSSGVLDPGTDGLWSLREAVCVAQALPGADVIDLPSGVYALNAPLEITDSLTISGAGMDATTIDASATDKAVEAYAWSGLIDLNLSELTIVGGDAVGTGFPEGGALSTFFVSTFLDGVRITGGNAVSGGGISSVYGDLTLLDSLIEENTATSSGGAISVVGELRMQRTTVASNGAPTGAGIMMESSGSDVSTIEQSTIASNAASGNGGGIALSGFHQGQTVVTDTTFVGNSSVGSGGAVHSAGNAAGELLLSSTTVTGNTASAGGGVAQDSGTVIVQHSIVAENVGGDLVGNAGGAGNIVGVAGGTVVDGVGGNRAGTSNTPIDPQLRTIGSFGGPTETRVPLPNSPAIDTGMSCGAVDQRGETRLLDGGCDVGAVELTVAPDTEIVTGPASPIGSGDASFTLSAAGGTAPYTFECELEQSGVFEACSSDPSFSGLADGEHTFAARAVDALGATDPSTSTTSWTVDLTAPVIVWDSVQPGTAVGDTSTFAFSATDASGIAGFECSLDGAPFAACASPVTTSALPEGDHHFRVRASDVVGNVSDVAEQSWSVVAAPQVGSTPTAGDSAEPVAQIAQTGGADLSVMLVPALALVTVGALCLIVRRRIRY